RPRRARASPPCAPGPARPRRRRTSTCTIIPGPRSASPPRSASSSGSSPDAAEPPPLRGMNRMRSLIATLVPALLRHLEAYANLAGEDVRDAATMLARKLAAVLAAAAAGFVALLMLCLWLVVLAWDGPWRNWVAGGLALGFALA